MMSLGLAVASFFFFFFQGLQQQSCLRWNYGEQIKANSLDQSKKFYERQVKNATYRCLS